MALFLDLPEKPIEQFGFSVFGWVAGPSADTPTQILINGRPCRHRFHERPDLRSFFPPPMFASGVHAIANLIDYAGEAEILIELRFGAEAVAKTVQVTPAIRERVTKEAQLRTKARAWCRERLHCPSCFASTLQFEGDRILCADCGAVYLQDSRALSLISPALRASSNIADTENVSSNPYTPAALSLIEETARAGGMVLDCGAGSRPRRLNNVINVEIVDYLSTDVLAIGEALPFQSNVFDATLSLAVLEHVRDPFKCAEELLRVTKPNGVILLDVPFLQPEHGFPHHYYNMTQQGLSNLFAGKAEILSVSVPPHGHPIWALQWFARNYLTGLPEGLREEFSRKTLGELAKPLEGGDLARPEVASLSPEATKSLACLNTLAVRKL